MYKIGIGQKIGMTRVFDEQGKEIAVSVLSLFPAYILRQTKTGVEVAYRESKKAKKPILGILKKSQVPLKLSKIVHFKMDAEEPLEKSLRIDIFSFQPQDKVKVWGTSKGKGFAGTIKRHGFHRGPMSHGSEQHRRPGSIGSAFPQRVVKGKKMAGHMGSEKVTVRNLEVIKIIPKENLLLLKGAVPGPKKGEVFIQGV
ncbi:50S ribosomal protein L3 [Candidatus Berkelbacteria bacterium]|nr:50S ribosomal protein L3 [Candidatus Berkelbacteria bacterium]MBI2588140.1 50S ribosomal protein L3 [Candidatus Berkelbacteria bacterium]